jgi:arginine repressor
MARLYKVICGDKTALVCAESYARAKEIADKYNLYK